MARNLLFTTNQSKLENKKSNKNKCNYFSWSIIVLFNSSKQGQNRSVRIKKSECRPKFFVVRHCNDKKGLPCTPAILFQTEMQERLLEN